VLPRADIPGERRVPATLAVAPSRGEGEVEAFDSRSWVSAYGVRSETERAIQIHSPTLNAASAASEPSQSESLRSMGRTRMKPGRKCIATIVQHNIPHPARIRHQTRRGSLQGRSADSAVLHVHVTRRCRHGYVEPLARGSFTRQRDSSSCCCAPRADADTRRLWPGRDPHVHRDPDATRRACRLDYTPDASGTSASAASRRASQRNGTDNT